MIGDTGCCGFSGIQKGPNLFGLLTLSVPMLVVCLAVYPLMFVLGAFNPAAARRRDQVRIIIRANFNLIHQKTFFPLFRCKMAGTVFRFSPRLSGWLYRSFNLAAFLLIWLCVLLPVLAWIK